MPQISGDDSGDRLDVFAARSLGVTRSFAQRLLREAGLKPSAKVQGGRLYPLPEPGRSPDLEDLEPERVDFRVVYEDDDLAVIDKPAGLVVHPAPGHWRGTLVHGLLWRYPEMRRFQGSRLRPGIVHRLDATTSGLMVVARRQAAMDALQRMFQARQVTKEYLALAHGAPARREGVLSGPIARDPSNPLRMAVVDGAEGGRPALTGYRVLWTRRPAAAGPVSLVLCSLFTGRTHQIRVHMGAWGYPLVGDALYGAPKGEAAEGRVFLHSWRLAFRHPLTEAPLAFRLPLPKDFQDRIASLIGRGRT